jgi:hypothetical protein
MIVVTNLDQELNFTRILMRQRDFTDLDLGTVGLRV